MARQDGPGIIIVDQIEFLRTGIRHEDPIDELDKLATGLKCIARELNIPVVAMAGYKSARGGQPSLSRFREQDTLTHHADVVVVLDTPDHAGDGEVELTIVKNRNGALGRAALRRRAGPVLVGRAIYPGFAAGYRWRTRRFDPAPYALEHAAPETALAAA
jgi:replicative DNA helicase